MNISFERLREVLIEELEDKTCEPVKLPFEEEFLDRLLFDGATNFKNFAKVLKPILTKIDFSNVSFKGYEAYDKDFSPYTGIKINPQETYFKDMSNSIFKGVEFIGSFDDVDVRGSDFSGSKGAKINPQTIKDKNLAKVKCKDVEFIGDFEGDVPLFYGVNIKGTDFNGSNYEFAIKDEEEFRKKVKQIFLMNNKPN